MKKMEPIEKYKTLKKLDKILDFFEEKIELNFLLKNKLYRNIIVQTIFDFQYKEGKKDFRYYPWHKKIIEKRKEMYGF